MDSFWEVHEPQGVWVVRAAWAPLLYRSFFASFQHHVNGAARLGDRGRPLVNGAARLGDRGRPLVNGAARLGDGGRHRPVWRHVHPDPSLARPGAGGTGP
jgi:hypothetical protein